MKLFDRTAITDANWRDQFNDFLNAYFNDYLLPYSIRRAKDYNMSGAIGEDAALDVAERLLNNQEGATKAMCKSGYVYTCLIYRLNTYYQRGLRYRNILPIENAYDIEAEKFDDHYEHVNCCLEVFVRAKVITSLEAMIIRLWLEGYSYKEIGERLEMNSSYVGVRFFRAKKKLRNCPSLQDLRGL